MPYESLQNELERRLGRKAEFRNQEETLDFRSENWSGDEEGQLAKALAKARERAKQVRKPLKIERLPHRDQRSLKDFESEDEAIVVEGYRPKRVEAWTSAGNAGNINAVIFYVGDWAERRYTMLDATTPRTERELLGFTRPQITGGSSIINPTGITRADVDELMQYSTGEPWNGKYVLYTEEGNFLFYEPKTFKAEPAMAVKCFECERPGYSDEMSRFALGYLCARCSRPEIDWSRYDAESFASDSMSLKRTEQEILKYLSNFNPERIENKYEAPEALTLPSIANAVGMVRSGVHRPLKELKKRGFVVEVLRRPPGRRRQVKVYFPTHEGRVLGRHLSQAYSSESISLDIDGDGIIEPWELAQQGMLNSAMQEFNAPRSKSYYKPSELRERAIEVMKTHEGWMGKEELVAKINADLPARRKTTSFNVSRALGAGRGGVEPFYVTTDGRIYYYGDQDRGEFIKGVI